jgi:hypothetical protein
MTEREDQMLQLLKIFDLLDSIEQNLLVYSADLMLEDARFCKDVIMVSYNILLLRALLSAIATYLTKSSSLPRRPVSRKSTRA